MGRKRTLVEPKNRLRVNKACDRCKRLKIKCDGLSPCVGCAKFGTKCVYGEGPVTKARYSETAKAGGGNYLSYLENKVRQLEKVVDRVLDGTAASVGDQGPGLELLYLVSKMKWRVIRTDQNILVEGLSNLLYDSLSPQNRLLIVKPRIQFYGWNLLGSHYIKSSQGFNDSSPFIDNWKNLLGNDASLSEYLVNYFLVEINPLFVIVDKKIFLQQYQRYMSNLSSSAHVTGDTARNNENLFIAILYLIYAISLRFTEMGLQQHYRFGLEEQLFEISYEIVSKLSFHWESFELIQGWVLIFFYLRSTYKRLLTHLVLSNAVKMVQGMAIDYYITTGTRELSSEYEGIKARRIFWCVYTMDKLFSLHSGNTSLIDDRQMGLVYPSWSFLEEKDGWLTPAALAMIKLAVISRGSQCFKLHDNWDLENFDYRQVEYELMEWKTWCKQNGLWDAPADGYFKNEYYQNPKDELSSLMINQLKLHYFYAFMTLQIKAVYPLVDKFNMYTFSSKNKDVNFHNYSKLVENFQLTLLVLREIHLNNLLLTPWYLTLSVLLIVGISSLTLINGGIHLNKAPKIFIEVLNILTILRSPVYTKHPKDSLFTGQLVIVNNEIYEVSYQDKAKMCKEIIWVLKLLNHMMMLRNSQLLSSLGQYIDHGSGEENIEQFQQMGVNPNKKPSSPQKLELSPYKNNFDNYLNQDLPSDLLHEFIQNQPLVSQPVVSSPLTEDILYATRGVKDDLLELLGSLHWFDQWGQGH